MSRNRNAGIPINKISKIRIGTTINNKTIATLLTIKKGLKNAIQYL